MTIQHPEFNHGLLNPSLDVRYWASEFRRHGRIQITDALNPDVAESLHRCLSTQLEWTVAYRDRQGARKLWEKELAEMPANELDRLWSDIEAVARDEFQFVYNSYMMIEAYQQRRDPHLALHRVTELVNQPPFLNAMRVITDDSTIIKTFVQATRYMAGHFLKHHNDFENGEDRRSAFVINLSKDWEAHWGGLLQILDPDGNVVDTMMPAFNTISLFKVPAAHCVSPVANYVTGQRLAITGWLRADR